jgi:spermidine/putrescine-binding protein
MRRWLTVRVQMVAALSLTGLLAAACGSGGPPSGAAGVVSSAPNPASCKGVTLHFIGLAGEDGKQISKSFQKKYNMKIVENNVADWGDSISAIKIGQPYDLMTVPMWYAQRMIAAGVVRPLDTARLSNWKNMFPGVARNSLIQANGKTYGAPIGWGDGPYVYNPKLVSASTLPKTILDLLKPVWNKRYVLFNSDSNLSLIAIADGYTKDSGTLLTKAQFARVEQQGKELVSHAQAFTTSYQDGTDRLVSGDAALDVGGWEAMLNFAKAKGATLKYGFFSDYLGGWFDSLGIPVTATHPQCALAYINYILTPKVEASLATSLVSGTTNRLSVPYIGKGDRIYNYKTVDHIVTPAADITTFPDPTPPNNVPKGYATLQDWTNAWQNISAGV